MPFEVPVPVWMPGDEAIRHIQSAEQRTEDDAIDQLKTAIAHSAIGVRVPDLKLPQEFIGSTGPGSSPMVSPGRGIIPTKKAWTKADVRADGTVAFGDPEQRFQFEVIRETVLRTWYTAPTPPLRSTKIVPLTERRKSGPRSARSEVFAILDDFAAADPTFVDQIEHKKTTRQRLIEAIWEKAGKTDQDKGWSERALRDHINAWIKAKHSPDHQN